MYYQELYDDLNVDITCMMEIENNLTVGQVILTVNGHNITVDDSTADKIFEAVKTRSINKIRAEEAEWNTDFLVRQDENKQQMKREDYL